MGWRVPLVPERLGAGDSGLAPACARAEGLESPTDMGQVRSALLGSPSARLVQVDRGSSHGVSQPRAEWSCGTLSRQLPQATAGSCDRVEQCSLAAIGSGIHQVRPSGSNPRWTGQRYARQASGGAKEGWRIGFSIPTPPGRSPSSVYVWTTLPLHNRWLDTPRG